MHHACDPKVTNSEILLTTTLPLGESTFDNTSAMQLMNVTSSIGIYSGTVFILKLGFFGALLRVGFVLKFAEEANMVYSV